MGNHEPRDDKVEQEYRVHSQGFPVLWLAVPEEYEGGVCGPREPSHCRDQAECEPQFRLSTRHHQDHFAHKQGHHDRRETVAEYTDGLEKGSEEETDINYNPLQEIFKSLNTHIFPPNNFEFSVTIADPIQTITNTCANSGPPSNSAFDEPWRMVAMNVQRIRGPHRSHSFSSVTGFSLGYST